MITEGVVTNG